MRPKFLTTGKAAELCSVTPDTVRKWIHSGWLPARRTPGGHHRIDERDLERILGQAQMLAGETLLETKLRLHPAEEKPSQFRYCWEYKNDEALPVGCRECAVYQMRAHRCYEVAKLSPEIGHNKLYCNGSCTECDYYRHVHMQETNVMVVTADPVLTSSLQADKPSAPYNLEITDCEYSCSAVVDRFRADYVVVDHSLGSEKASDICNHLLEDPRIPYVRVMMAVERGAFPEGCDKKIYARIEKPLHISDITECLDWTQSEGMVMT